MSEKLNVREVTEVIGSRSFKGLKQKSNEKDESE